SPLADSSVSETETQAKLQLPPRQRRGKAQRLAWGQRLASAHVEGRSEIRAYGVVDAGKVGAVEDVETFGHELQVCLLGHLELAAYAHVKGGQIGAQAGVAV